MRFPPLASHLHAGQITTLTFRIDELEPTHHVAWSSVQVPPAWEGTQVIFDITPEGETVNLRFSHAGFASTGGSFGITSYSWAQYLRSIKLPAPPTHPPQTPQNDLRSAAGAEESEIEALNSSIRPACRYAHVHRHRDP